LFKIAEGGYRLEYRPTIIAKKKNNRIIAAKIGKPSMQRKRIAHLLIVPIFLTLFSCHEEKKDTQKPDVNVVLSQHDIALSSADPIRGIIDIQVTAQDKGKIKLISVYVGNDLIKEEGAVTVSSFSFDTRTAEDGEYEIKSVVQDESGNVSENSLFVKIANTLFSYTVPGPPVSNTVTPASGIIKWLVLSDNTGNVIEYKNMKEGGTFKFLYPLDFKDADFDISIINYYDNPGNPDFKGSYDITTIKNVAPGQAVTYEDEAPSVGRYTLNGFNANSYSSYIFSSKDLVSYNYVSENQYALNLAQPTSDFYFWIGKQNQQQFYYYVPSISIGNALTIDDNFVSQMKPMTQQRIDFAADLAVNFAITVVSGKSKAGKDLVCSLTFMNESPFLLNYPKELNGPVLKGFISSVIYSKIVGPHVVTFSYTKDTQDFLTAIEELQADLTSISKKNYPTIEMSFTGSADYIEYQLEAADPAIMGQQWKVYSKFNTTANVKLPQFSADLLQKIGIASVSGQVLKSVSLNEFASVTSYNQLTDLFLGTSSQNFYYNQKAKTYALFQGNSGGRNSLKKRIWSAVPDRMKTSGIKFPL
jgi:hypothetical protein